MIGLISAKNVMCPVLFEWPGRQYVKSNPNSNLFIILHNCTLSDARFQLDDTTLWDLDELLSI